VKITKDKIKEDLEEETRKTDQLNNSKDKMKNGRRFLPKTTNQNINEWGSRHSIGAFTT
jgi:hypothetical protein